MGSAIQVSNKMWLNAYFTMNFRMFIGRNILKSSKYLALSHFNAFPLWVASIKTFGNLLYLNLTLSTPCIFLKYFFWLLWNHILLSCFPPSLYLSDLFFSLLFWLLFFFTTLKCWGLRAPSWVRLWSLSMY